jgi:hypothetical protein
MMLDFDAVDVGTDNETGNVAMVAMMRDLANLANHNGIANGADNEDDNVALVAQTFPGTPTKGDHNQRTRGDTDCTVCMECLPDASESANTAVLPCGHALHLTCFVQYVRAERRKDLTCPLCRTIVPTETTVPASPPR